jgi:kynurenine formamidase
MQVRLKCLQVNSFSYPEDGHRILLHAGMYLPNSMNNCRDTLECNAELQIFAPPYRSGTGKSASVGIAV